MSNPDTEQWLNPGKPRRLSEDDYQTWLDRLREGINPLNLPDLEENPWIASPKKPLRLSEHELLQWEEQLIAGDEIVPAQFPLDKTERIISGLEKEYEAWWELTMRLIYDKRSGGRGKQGTEEGYQQFLERNCTTRSERFSYEYDQLPNKNFFRENILPIIRLMADSPSELEQIGHTALEALNLLLTNERHGGNYILGGNLAHYFFQKREVHMWSGYEGASAATGQFKYFYEKYGAMAAKAVALYQSQWCDEHHEGGTLYTRSTGRVLRLFEPVLEAVPREHWDAAFQAFITYGGRHSALTYFCNLPKIVKGFREQGREDLLADYFALSTAAPHIDSERLEIKDFPIHDPKLCITEFEALGKFGELKPDILGAAQTIIRRAGILDGHHRVTFTGDETPEGQLSFYGSLSFGNVISTFRANGYSTRRIREILQLPAAHPWLGMSGAKLVQHFDTIEHNFPGGSKALVLYLSRMKDAPRVISAVMLRAVQTPLTDRHHARYLEVGAKLVAKLGDNAACYFDKSMEDTRWYALLTSNPREFEKTALNGAQFALSCPTPYVYKGRRSPPEDSKKLFFDGYLRFWGDPRFDEYVAAGNHIMSEAQRLISEPSLRDSSYDKANRIEQAGSAFRHLALHFTPRADYEPHTLPETDITEEARVITAFSLFGSDYCYEYDRYLELRHRGCDRYVASGGVSFAVRNARITRDFKPLPGITPTVPEQKAREAFRLYYGTTNAIRALLHGHDSLRHQLDHHDISRNELVQMLDLAQLSNVQHCLRSLQALQRDPEIAHAINFAPIIQQATEAIRLAEFNGALKIGLSDRSMDLPRVPLLESANPSTAMTISGISLLLAVGAAHLPGVSDDLSLPPVPIDTRIPLLGASPESSIVRGMQTPSLERVIRRNIRVVLPRVAEYIKQARMQIGGTLAVGGKIHTPHAMNDAITHYICQIFGLDQTYFRLQHANDSLVLPPLPSGAEMQLLLLLLQKIGVCDPDQAQLQFGGAGRLVNENAALVGSSMLLGTTQGGNYKPGAFSTTHDKQTGARIMAYDGGVKVEGLPFDIPKAEGRTDMLGLKSADDPITF